MNEASAGLQISNDHTNTGNLKAQISNMLISHARQTRRLKKKSKWTLILMMTAAITMPTGNTVVKASHYKEKILVGSKL